MPKGVRHKRHLRRQWRKIDTSDLEAAMVQKTFDATLGGNLGDRPNSALFAIDKSSGDKVTRAERKQRAKEKVLQVDKILAPNPYTKAEKTAPKSRKRSADDALIERIRKRPKTEIIEPARNEPLSNGLFDIWDPAIEKNEADALISKNPSLEKGYLSQTKSKRRKGASYNPSFEDHQGLLRTAYEIELRRQKEEKEFKEKMKREQFVKGELLPSEEEEDDEIDAEDEESGDDEVNKPKTNIAFVDRKLKSERNKEKRKREMEFLQKRRDEDKFYAKKAKDLESIQKTTLEELKMREEKLKAKELRKLERLKQPKSRLGPEKYKAPEIDYKLTEELPGNLRNVSSDYSLIRERFDSFRQRGVIETRTIKNYDRRYKMKEFEKFPHKEYTKAQAEKYSDKNTD